MVVLSKEAKILRACVELSKRIKDEHPIEIEVITLNALLQSTIEVNNKEFLKPIKDILESLEKKLEDNIEVIAIACMVNNLIERGNESYKKEEIEQEIFILPKENEEGEIKERYDIEKRLVQYLNDDILDSEIIRTCSYIDETYYCDCITEENITDHLLAYSVLQGIKMIFDDNDDYSLKDVFEEIEIREFTERNKFDEALNINEILREMNKFLDEMINHPADIELEFIDQDDLKDFLFGRRGKNLKKLKEISKKYKELAKVLEELF